MHHIKRLWNVCSLEFVIQLSGRSWIHRASVHKSDTNKFFKSMDSLPEVKNTMLQIWDVMVQTWLIKHKVKFLHELTALCSLWNHSELWYNFFALKWIPYVNLQYKAHIFIRTTNQAHNIYLPLLEISHSYDLKVTTADGLWLTQVMCLGFYQCLECYHSNMCYRHRH